VAEQMTDLENTWLSWNKINCPLTQTDQIGPILTMIYRGYQYYSNPIKNFLKKNLLVSNLISSPVKYINSAMKLGDGELRIGGNINGNKDENLMVLEIMASMAFVPVTQSVNITGSEYDCGGFRNTIPVKSLIENSNKLDRIYVINVSPEKRPWDYQLTKNDIDGLLPKLNYIYGNTIWPEANKAEIEIGSLMFGNTKEYITVYPEFVKLESFEFDSNLIKEAYLHGIEVATKIK
jgi:predicted patatin/cPLA2 family phospholipase